MKRKISKKILILIFLAIGLWFLGVNEPFVGSYGANLNYFTLASKNFRRFGYFKLHFLPTYYSGGNLTKLPEFYLHHPVLYYSLVSIPYRIFGFHNWVSAVTPLIFSLLTVFWLYKIGSFLWDKKAGFWSSFFGAVFPIMTIFARQTIFEPAVLSILLGVYYYFLCYLKYKKTKSLIFLTLLSLLAVLIDWGGAYFIFPFVLLYPFYPKGKEKLKAVLIYCLTVLIGLSFFLLLVFVSKGNFSDLVNAVLSRKSNSELFGLTTPWLRLLGLSLVRVTIYFSPFALLALYIFLKKIIREIKSRKITLPTLTLLFFFIFGLLNLIVLPAATFGHIYFLLFFLPFFAFILGKYTSDLYTRNRTVSIVMISSIIMFSSLITFLKWQQVKKQVWRYEVAGNISKELEAFEEIAVRGFPGDIFEQYFYHPTKPIDDYTELLKWLSEGKPGAKKAVFSCWDKCSEDDFEFLNNLPYKIDQFGKAWLITNLESNKVFAITSSIVTDEGKKEELPLVLKLYRLVRDRFKVGQL